MRNLYNVRGVQRRQLVTPSGTKYRGDESCGCFVMMSASQPGDVLRIMAAAGDGWDHVSVSLVNRIPTWEEMEQVKRSFFEENETAMQLHVPPSDHVNHHPFCLHLWRPHKVEIPRPPAEMVGPKT